MQFTPQQLTGGPKYMPNTRMGNWNEDVVLQELCMKDFLSKKESGSLKITAKQRQLEECLVRAPLCTTPEDGFLRFGQKIMLKSEQSKGYLSVNPYDVVTKQCDAYMLTTSPMSEPCVRNIFVIERANPNDGFEDDIVHYGQSIRCVSQPFGSTIKAPTYMHSEMVTALSAAKFSRHQEVLSSLEPNGETTWQLLYPDNTQRFEMDGECVPTNTPVVLRHNHTGSFLASDEIPYNNLFGQEWEVHCFPYFSLNKTQNLVGEKKGDITGDYQLRKHGLPNVWTVCAASGAASGSE